MTIGESAVERGRLPIWITLDSHLPSVGVQSFLREISPFGVILFSRHLKDPAQVRELTSCISGALGEKIAIALDQEGGRVSRLAAVGHIFPGACELAGDTGSLRACAEEMGHAMKDLGFTVDFAPVADLGPDIPGTGLEGRLYSSDPDAVIRCCRAFLEGLSLAGIEGCLKHFPGLGGAAKDTHKDLPFVPGDGRSRAEHIKPFATLRDAAPFVMTSHALYEFLGQELPASLNPNTYSTLHEIGFTGLSVTDDLCMGAVCGSASLADLAERSLAAGADIALFVSDQEKTLEVADRLRG